MSDDSKAVATISPKHMDLVDADMSKIELAENELSEVVYNLKSLADVADKSIKTAASLAEAAQHPDMFDSLAKLLVAGAKINREASLAISSKVDLYKSQSNPNAPIAGPVSGDTNVIIATSTDVIERIRNVIDSSKQIGDDE